MTAVAPAVQLEGRRIAITSARGSVGELADALVAAGALPLVRPAIEIRDPLSWAALDDALRQVHRFAWVAFTSANAVRSVARRLEALHASHDWPGTVRLAAVGDATARVVGALLGTCDHVPAVHAAEALGRSLPVQAGDRVLFPAGDLAGAGLEDALRRRGALVERVEAYRTVRSSEADTLGAELLEGAIDGVLFASPSAVRAVADALAAAGRAPAHVFSSGVRAVCIGPVTDAAARAAGIPAVTCLDEGMSAILSAFQEAFARGREDT